MSLVLRKPLAIAFDLDGTLVDSLEDIALACNDGLTRLGLPPRSREDYRHLVGEGVPKLAERTLGQSHPQLIGRLAELTRARYRVTPIVHTRPYPGIAELIAALAAERVPLGVISNKPHELTLRVVDAFWPADTFRFVQGYVGEVTRKPSPHHLLAFARELSISTNDVWLIGDTPTDVETAKRAGATCLGVTWGFRPAAELLAAGVPVICQTTADILRHYQSAKSA